MAIPSLIDVIRLHYPGIQGVTVKTVKDDGTPYATPIDGLIWENTQYPKPTQSDIATWTPQIQAAYDLEQAIATIRRNAVSPAYRELVIAQSTTTQAISGTAKVTVAFPTKLNDPNNVLSNNIISVMTGGIYEVTVILQVTNQALALLTAFYNWQIYLTTTIGSTVTSYLFDQYTHGLLSTAPATLQGTLETPIPLGQGDKIQIHIQKDLAASLNITSAIINVKKICEGS